MPSADPIGNASRLTESLTGEVQERLPVNDGKDRAAQSLGRRGGEARAKSLSSKRKLEIAKKAATARWSKRVTRSR